MLEELTIKNFIIIDKLNVSFKSKMNVLTGETGSGKSVIVDAISLLLGSRGSSDFIRKGANKSFLQAQFSIEGNRLLSDILDQLEIEHSDNTLILRRDIYSNGRSVCRVNSILVNLSILRRIGKCLVDIQKQNDQKLLLDVSEHIHLLDGYYLPLQEKVLSYKKLYFNYIKLKKKLDKYQHDREYWSQKVDMLKFQIHEINDAHLNDLDEEKKLFSKQKQLDNYQLIYNSLDTSYQLIENSNGLIDKLGMLMSNLSKISLFSDKLDSIYKRISDLFYNLQDISSDILHHLDSMEWSDSDLQTIDKRLNLIFDLKKKYGNSIKEIIDYGNDAKKELNKIKIDNSASFKDKLNQLYKQVLESANSISEKRYEVAKRLEYDVYNQLKSLQMGKAIFKVNINTNKDKLNSNGIDNVEFCIQINPGEGVNSLNKTISGGELSRIMLALKTIFISTANVSTIIFDEIDVGTSGKIAQLIAEKIFKMSKYTQVLCISHSAQVAAIADQNYLICKEIKNNRTLTNIKILNCNQKIYEIARMLSGSKITEKALNNAKELVELNRKEDNL